MIKKLFDKVRVEHNALLKLDKNAQPNDPYEIVEIEYKKEGKKVTDEIIGYKLNPFRPSSKQITVKPDDLIKF